MNFYLIKTTHYKKAVILFCSGVENAKQKSFMPKLVPLLASKTLKLLVRKAKALAVGLERFFLRAGPVAKKIWVEDPSTYWILEGSE